MSTRIEWPLDTGQRQWRHIQFRLTVRAAQLRRIGLDLWIRPPFGILRHTIAGKTVFEARAGDGMFVTLDYDARSCLVRRGDGYDEPYRQLMAHLTGPLAPIYGVELGEADWLVRDVNAGWRVRSRHWGAALTLATIAKVDRLPIEAYTTSGVYRWKVLADDREQAPPAPPSIEGWRLEGVQQLNWGEVAHLAPYRIGTLEGQEALQFQSTSMAHGLQFLDWREGDREVRVVRGVAEQAVGSQRTVYRLVLDGAPALITGTDADSLDVAIGALESHMRRELVIPDDTARIGYATSFVDESTENWRRRTGRLVAADWSEDSGRFFVPPTDDRGNKSHGKST